MSHFHLHIHTVCAAAHFQISSFNDVLLTWIKYERAPVNIQILHEPQEWLIFIKTCSTRTNKSVYSAQTLMCRWTLSHIIINMNAAVDFSLVMFYKWGARTHHVSICWTSVLTFKCLLGDAMCLCHIQSTWTSEKRKIFFYPVSNRWNTKHI